MVPEIIMDLSAAICSACRQLRESALFVMIMISVALCAGAAAPNAFPFPGATGDAMIRLGNPHEPWRAH